MMNRACIFGGIEAKPKRPDRFLHFLRRQAKRRDKNKVEAKDYADRLYNRHCRFLLFRLTKYGTGKEVVGK